MTNGCTVVFGPGRSGTSLTMKLLDQTGLRLSRQLEPESEDNPDGHFEDLAISRLLQDFVHSLGLSPYRPRNPAWVDAPNYRATRTGLISAVQTELAAGAGPWGFKDPRICLTWPMWQEIFATISVEPRLVFCSRDAASVVRSLMRAYKLPQSMCEGLYLYRCLHALEDVSEPWFFVQYSQWAQDGVKTLTGLTEHCGLDTSELDLAAVAQEHFSESLNRQSSGTPIELSGVVRELDELLAGCVGDQYDTGAIADFCASVHGRVDAFKFVSDALEHTRIDTRPAVFRSVSRVLSRASRSAKRLGSR